MRRLCFTLIELLIVIAIIAILVPCFYLLLRVHEIVFIWSFAKII